MRWIVLIAVVLLTACATDARLSVSAGQLPEYWVVHEGPAGIDLSSLSASELTTGGAGTVQYRIDQNGRVHDVRIVKSVPTEFWGQFAAKVVRGTRYKPAAGNDERRPVEVMHRVSFGERYHHTDDPNGPVEE